MEQLAETLDYAKEEIGKSDQLQKEVLANVTHDLKTPLTMIKAYASMIQEISGNDPVKRAKHTQGHHRRIGQAHLSRQRYSQPFQDPFGHGFAENFQFQPFRVYP